VVPLAITILWDFGRKRAFLKDLLGFFKTGKKGRLGFFWGGQGNLLGRITFFQDSRLLLGTFNWGPTGIGAFFGTLLVIG